MAAIANKELWQKHMNMWQNGEHVAKQGTVALKGLSDSIPGNGEKLLVLLVMRQFVPMNWQWAYYLRHLLQAEETTHRSEDHVEQD